MVKLTELVAALEELLQPQQFKDYCPNGLQVEGQAEITRLVTGVTANQALIERAIDSSAQAILVHHGYFWKGEPPVVTGMKKARLKKLLDNDISLIAYHLPLDVHPTLGNNAQLAQLLDLKTTGGLEPGNPRSVGLCGELQVPMTAVELQSHINQRLQRMPMHIAGGAETIRTVAWCTGAAQSYIDLAVEAGVDAFITGEISEPTVHTAREMGIHFYAAGHHATERYGVKAVGEHLQEQLGIDVEFIDIDNPV